MSKTELKSLKVRAQALRLELQDPTCQRFALARKHVAEELARVEAQLAHG